MIVPCRRCGSPYIRELFTIAYLQCEDCGHAFPEPHDISGGVPVDHDYSSNHTEKK